MREFHGCATTRADVNPQAVFDLITDVGRLPEWNGAIEAVTDRPPALAEGAEWTVTMHPPHTGPKTPASPRSPGVADRPRQRAQRDRGHTMNQPRAVVACDPPAS